MDARRKGRGVGLKLSGKDKAQLLLTVLGDKGKMILDKLSPEASEMLMSEVGSAPKRDPQILAALLREIQAEVVPVAPLKEEASLEKQDEKMDSAQTGDVADDSAKTEETGEMKEDEDDGLPRDA